jgi:hypothetical protein
MFEVEMNTLFFVISSNIKIYFIWDKYLDIQSPPSRVSHNE